MKVNEIFYSLQGEGQFTGTPAVFLRLSGCNTQCPFCDTHHHDGEEMSESDIVNRVSQYPTRHIVITGGEPTLQINDTLICQLHDKGFFVQIETNGSLPMKCQQHMPDWITCSPKNLKLNIQQIHELKVLFDGEKPMLYTHTEDDLSKYAIKHRCLQPLDSGNELKNKEILRNTINYILQNPTWTLSLQTHKIINIQ